ncbi:MAG: helix-turn-helix domain-containing protein [Beijerinckiaceae bacterium]|nr:helix-turn-helix domain-containing protein [Beijerinckiaceae bacterium]
MFDFDASSRHDESKEFSYMREDRTTPTEQETAFGRRVESVMRAKGLSPATVAKALGSSESNIRKIWGGYAVRQYLQLAVLAQALGVSPMELLGLGSTHLEARAVLNAVQAVVESLGFDRVVARNAAEIALEAATRPRVLDEPDDAEIRAIAKLLMRPDAPARS